jgi:hypothetical protein
LKKLTRNGSKKEAERAASGIAEAEVEDERQAETVAV